MNAADAVSPELTFAAAPVPGNKGIWDGIFCALVIFSQGRGDFIKRIAILN